MKYGLFFPVAMGCCLALVGCAEDVLSAVGTVTDEFEQRTAASTDVLWVVDNSESMSEEQSGLGQSFAAFIDNLINSQVDYHIGVVSTDTNDGGVLHAPTGVPVIGSTTSDPSGTFLNNIQVGVDGSRVERAFETAALALGVGAGWRPGDAITPPNAGFIRPDASLFIIMVSDEDDKSFGPVGYYQRLFDGYKGPGFEGRISVSSIAGPTPDGCSSTRGSAAAGDRYVELSDQTGGITVSICNDFTSSLQNLSITAARLSTTFELSQAANPGGFINNCGSGGSTGFCVRVNSTVVPSDDGQNWSYDSDTNSIIFQTGAIPPPQARITVEYQVGRR